MLVFPAGVVLSPFANAQQDTMPAGMSDEEHLKQMAKNAEMNKRGILRWDSIVKSESPL